MDLEEIKTSLQKIPSWVWIAGGGIVILLAFLFLKKGGSSTTTGTGQTSDFTGALGGLADAVNGIGSGGGGGTSGGSSGGDSSSPITNNPVSQSPVSVLPPNLPETLVSPISHIGGTSAPVTPTPVYEAPAAPASTTTNSGLAAMVSKIVGSSVSVVEPPSGGYTQEALQSAAMTHVPDQYKSQVSVPTSNPNPAPVVNTTAPVVKNKTKTAF
jgi:hypothetical protein